MYSHVGRIYIYINNIYNIPKLKIYVFYTSCQKYSHVGPTKKLQFLVERKIEDSIPSLQICQVSSPFLSYKIPSYLVGSKLKIWNIPWTSDQKYSILGPTKKWWVTKLKFSVGAYLVMYSQLGPTKNTTYLFGWANN